MEIVRVALAFYKQQLLNTDVTPKRRYRYGDENLSQHFLVAHWCCDGIAFFHNMLRAHIVCI
jgi:hypothetical protein